MAVTIAIVDEYDVWQFAAAAFSSQLPLQGINVPTLLVSLLLSPNGGGGVFPGPGAIHHLHPYSWAFFGVY